MASVSRSKLLIHPDPDRPGFTTVIYIMALNGVHLSSVTQPWGHMYKIGITTNIAKRFASLQNGNPEIDIVWRSKPCANDDAKSVEWLAHMRMDTKRVKGTHAREWFRLNTGELSSTRKYITDEVDARRDRILKYEERQADAQRLLQAVPDGFLTAREYLREIGLEDFEGNDGTARHTAILSNAATRHCKKTNTPIEVKYIPGPPRRDGTCAARPFNAYPRSVLAACWAVMVADR